VAVAKKGDLYVNIPGCVINVWYQYKVFAKDTWGNTWWIATQVSGKSQL